MSDPATVVVRPLAAGDREAWERLFRGYLAFYEATLEDPQFDLTWSRLTAPPPADGPADMWAFLALVDGAAVGLVQGVLHASTWTAGPYLYLQDLFVDPDARDQGVGRTLIQAAYAHADAVGASRTYWLTHEANATARILYDAVAKRSGFIQYRRA